MVDEIKPNRSISRRLMFAAVLVAGIPLVLAIATLMVHEYDRSIHLAKKVQTQVAERMATHVEAFFQSVTSALKIPPRFNDLQSMSSSEQELVLSQLLSYWFAFKELGLLDHQGRIMAYLSRDSILPPPDFVKPSALAAAENLDGIFTGSVIFDKLNGKPSIQVTQALRSRPTGRVYGFLLATIELKSIWNIFDALRLEEGEDAYLLDNGARVVAHRDPTLVLRGTSFYYLPNEDIQNGLVGRPAIIATRTISFGKQVFTLVIEQDLNVALAAYYQYLITGGVILGISLIFTAAITGVLVRWIVTPIRAVSSAAKLIHTRDLSSRVPVTSMDEIGEMAESFNKMLDRLQNVVNELEQSKVEQFRIIKSRTEDLRRVNLELKREIKERRRAEEQATAASTAKSKFLTNMSHELRTPLNAIIGFSQLMDMEVFGSLGDSHYISYVKDIEESAQHLLEIINDLLDLSKIESGRFELVEDTLSLGSVVQTAVELMHNEAERREVKLVGTIQDCMPDILGDSRLLKQILLNLISNSLKFTPTGGQISVRAFIDPLGKPSISVSDTGPGMKKSQVEKSLSPFEQLDGRHKPNERGTGLGLTLCKNFAELHGGDLEINTAPDKGMHVTVHFPIERIAISNLEHEVRS